MQKLIYFQSFILFVLMFTFPKVLSNVKILLVIFISLGHLAFLLSGKLKLNIYYLMYHLIFSTLTLFFLLNGLASGNSDVAILDGFRLYFGFMILYYFIFIGFDRLDFVTLILKAYCVLTKKFKFALVMTRILIIFTILVGIYNILRLYTLNSIILLYIATWLAGLIYVLFGIGLLRIKKISIMFTVLAVFYIVAGVFNASLILMVLLPAMAVTTAVVEAVLFKHLAK